MQLGQGGKSSTTSPGFFALLSATDTTFRVPPMMAVAGSAGARLGHVVVALVAD